MEQTIHTALQYIALDGEDEINLATGLSLIRPNERLLSRRWHYSMSEAAYDDEATASRYLVCRFPERLQDGDALEAGTRRFYAGLMAIQIIKPVQTLGFIYHRTATEHRQGMDAGPWARMREFDSPMLQTLPPLIAKLQQVFDGKDVPAKNAVTLLQLGLENRHPYIACLLWVMGLEALFDSSDRETFSRRLTACLGARTLAFPDWNPGVTPPPFTVADIALHLYMFRSKLAHGADLRKASQDKKYPVDLLAQVEMTELLQPVSYATMLCEASCYLLCQVLRNVL